ncbi:galactose-1-phosphate uridylyltransferase (plasmid) [Deinococcus metallilatus]|uniref:Galactose-1-phosphate uridylyltransferase n=1 Tax=Deinococcus metallilatus TaxID=1211322 RepID=A0AAJ5F5X9_9DEIO|nr:galactose-1-phosphate uridylyltransferase [Deinococcus metallilatus]MBB5293247.1 UDPglucose--hexose-1-phosphate uridylyltransferase [Deinococcus metallilatus]QBY07033.1 galactose-1-phosphate uridylyltransferase [Deinococcus metallilatus]RXJ18044.1 galactose-1-phosphate uridylyltransferase [Deinococcus metallilatus]TLK31980.1 galactose-1-phosphate uridylyltransferase [Deinococcus metallilatus]GMA15530.1 galactose-1-phosphate uridylyltransferase [Deinococcus metallilatus]
MYKSEFVKPDGRALILYGLTPVEVSGPIPSPGEAVEARPQMRWHPVRGEWVIYAAHRLNRTFLPPPEYNPLAPTHDPEHPTELPPGNYDLAVFENRFPSLTLDAPTPDPVPDVTVRAGRGKCEVVVFSQDPGGTLGGLPAEQVRLLIDVWADRTTCLGRDPQLQYVLPFENRGVEVGVTLHHPHGQIYAYDHLPPVQTRALTQMRAYLAEHGRPWLEDFVRQEREAGLRVVRDEGQALSVVPPFARFTYEMWVLPTRAVAFLSDLREGERDALAAVLKDALTRLDTLFGVRMPYLLTVQQAPTDGQAYPEWPLRIEISPYLRAPGRMKYLAGTEQGAGEFVNDALPEQKAAELREVKDARQ